VREVGKALGLSLAELDRLAKVSQGGSAKTIREEMGQLADYRDKLNAPLRRDLADLVEQIAGFPRHLYPAPPSAARPCVALRNADGPRDKSQVQ
jgi:error-prone DNA polymerase